MSGVIRQRGGPNSEDELVAQLFDEQFGPLTRAVVLLIDDVREAEEVAQEAFTRLLTSRRRMRKLDDAPAYLRTIAFNLARSRLRRRRTERGAQHLVEQQAAEYASTAQPTPETSAIARASEAQMLEALTTLPVRQRECLVLRYYMSLSEAEISHTLNISKGSVKTHTSRGLASLQLLLGTSGE